MNVAPDGTLYFSALLLDEPVTQLDPRRAHGIQVASSRDGGVTWDTNVAILPGADPTVASVALDRQWLASGPGGEVIVSFKRNLAGQPNAGAPLPFLMGAGVYVTTSRDGGATFGPFQEVLGGAGLVLGIIEADRGTIRTLAVEPGGEALSPISFPRVVVANDALYVVWRDAEGIGASASTDGGATWVATVRASDPEEPAALPPWAEVREGALVVVRASDGRHPHGLRAPRARAGGPRPHGMGRCRGGVRHRRGGHPVAPRLPHLLTPERHRGSCARRSSPSASPSSSSSRRPAS